MERLKESADLIAESQQKQINLLLEDKRERMEDRERLVKENDFLKTQLKELTDAMIETKYQLKAATEVKGVGRPKKTECSPCIADPSM
jgi:gamma-glutamyltranspeptidase